MMRYICVNIILILFYFTRDKLMREFSYKRIILYSMGEWKKDNIIGVNNVHEDKCKHTPKDVGGEGTC